MMKKMFVKKTISMSMIYLLLFTAASGVVSSTKNNDKTDFDPLVDINVTVKILKIRSFDKIDWQLLKKEYVDSKSDPDFYVKVLINDEEFKSPIWNNTKYVYNPNWSAVSNVPDNKEFVNIKIQLWDLKDDENNKDRLCDISIDSEPGDDKYDVELNYSIKTGHWNGDDFLSNIAENKIDPSGYGRLNGCDDGSIYKHERDCEIWFNIFQNDADGDGIPYQMEVNYYGTDPLVDNRGEDMDGDGVPIEWEWKWGYNPVKWENHSALDPDNDGLSNIEEYLTSQWGSDPFRKDIFLELDEMEPGPNGEGPFIPALTKDLLYDAFGKHNIVFHVDQGEMGGGEIIPFDYNTTGGFGTGGELQEIYTNYFLHNDPNCWRRGVFHYGLVIYHAVRYPGFVFATTADGENYSLDSFQVSKKMHDAGPLNKHKFMRTLLWKTPLDAETARAIVYASAIMHETGHTLGLFSWNIPGVDQGIIRSIADFIKFLPFISYRSCMNYGYTYVLVDYSDGSHGYNDFDDWDNIDLTLFQKEFR